MFCNPVMLLKRRYRPLAKRKSSLRSHHLLALRRDDVLNSSLNSRLSHSSIYNATWIIPGRPLNFPSLNEAFKHLNLKSILKMLVNETRRSFSPFSMNAPFLFLHGTGYGSQGCTLTRWALYHTSPPCQKSNFRMPETSHWKQDTVPWFSSASMKQNPTLQISRL